MARMGGLTVVIDGADHDTRRAILELLPDRDAPESLFDAERIAEGKRRRALWRNCARRGITAQPSRRKRATTRLQLA